MNDIVPFGKHKGRPLEQLLVDQPYVNWLLAQPWFQEKYITIYNVVTGGGSEPAHTPEHNRMQMKFLDWDYRKRFVRLCVRRWGRSEPAEDLYEQHNVTRYEMAGIDVAIAQEWMADKSAIRDKLVELKASLAAATASFESMASDTPDTWKARQSAWEDISRAEIQIGDFEYQLSHIDEIRLAVELKPTIGDDFPEVMRQIKRRTEMAQRNDSLLDLFGYKFPYQVLVVGEYTGVGATVEQFVEFFRIEGIAVLFENTI